MADPSLPASGRLRELVSTAATLGGIWLIVGDRIIGSHDWRGGLSVLLVVVGGVEVLVGFRALREDWSWRAAGGATIGAAMLVLALILADSWRWLAAGAWTVCVIVAMKTAWPAPQDE